MDDEMVAFTVKAETEMLRMLKAWGEIETSLAPGMRRVIEIVLLMALVHTLEDRDDEHDRA